MRETQNTISQADKLRTYVTDDQTASSSIQIPLSGVKVREMKQLNAS